MNPRQAKRVMCSDIQEIAAQIHHQFTCDQRPSECKIIYTAKDFDLAEFMFYRIHRNIKARIVLGEGFPISHSFAVQLYDGESLVNLKWPKTKNASRRRLNDKYRLILEPIVKSRNQERGE